MTRATASKFLFTAVATFALACAPNFARAQRGGGHGGGGGFHGSGGGASRCSFSGAGLGRSSGGGSYSRGASGASTYGRGASRGGSFRAPSSPSRPSTANSYARSNGNSYRPSGGSSASAFAGTRAFRPNANSTEAARDGQWHSFRSAANSAGAQTRAAMGASISPSRAGALGSARPTINASRGLATSGAFAGRPFGNFGRFGRPGFSGSFPGRPFIGGRCCGFGFGLDLGLGFGWESAWAWDPFWYDSWSAWPPYDYGTYPPPPYAYPPSVGYDPNYDQSYDQSYDPNYNPDYDAAPNSSSARPSAPENPSRDTSLNAPKSEDAANSPAQVVIYLRNGATISPSDYWVVDDQMHCIVNGSESVVDLNRVDLPRTMNENQKKGIKFWIRSAPNENPGPADEAPSTAPAPDQRQNNSPAPRPAPAAPHTLT